MEINLTDRTKLTKSKTSDNFFPTQISVECQTTKLPFLFQNPIINSGFIYLHNFSKFSLIDFLSFIFV